MAQHEKFYLNGTWQLKKADETLLCPVEIPGSVLSGLTEHGLLEDPFYRMNEYPTRELLKNDFIFSREFELKKEEGRVYAREFDTLKSKKVPQSLEIGLFFCQIFIFII